MTHAVLTPYDTTEVVDLSGGTTYRKQVLPIGEITYKGRKIRFTREYLTDLANAFKERAYDQVPFILADPETNGHNEDPERFRGEVKGLELTNDGLDAVIEFSSPDAAKAVRENPRLGVSARIIEGLERADGKSWKRAIRHVLGTLDPRVPGMRPWSQVDLSDSDVETLVVDLTAATYERESDMARKFTDAEVAALEALKESGIDLSTLTAEQITTEDTEQTGQAGGDNIEDELAAMSDEELQALLDELDDPEDGDDPENVERGSNKDTGNTDLSNPVDAEARQRVAFLEQELAKERFAKERTALIQDGVPPHLVDLAQPLLETPEPHVIDLANEETLNATDLVRKILDGCKGYVDLSGEIGSNLPAEKDEDDVLEAWENEYPV